MFEKLIELIKKYDTIIIHRHSHPDGDALGSQLGLRALIKENFPAKAVYTVGDAAGRYSFMKNSTMNEIDDSTYEKALAVILDCPTQELVSDKRFALAAEKIRIDHHIYCETFTDFEIIDTSFESAAGMIALFAREQSLTVNVDAADAIYTGMVTDSGRFRYDSTNARTLELAAMLLSAGANADKIYTNLYSRDFSSILRQSQFINKIKIFEDSPVAYIYTTADEVKAMGFPDAASVSRGMVNVMSDIKGIDIWVNFTEDDGKVLCELRSSCYNINPVAVKYGGGGHKKASGADVHSFEEAMQMLSDLKALTVAEKAAQEAEKAEKTEKAAGGSETALSTPSGADVKRLILAKIREYDTIIISRHKRPDGDAVGSTLGLSLILKETYPDKKIYLDNIDRAEYLAFLGDEGPRPEESEYENALVIVLDTGTSDRIANPLAGKGRELIKIDHHVCELPYGDICWIEEERSSVCEMITDFYRTFRDELKITKEAAECLYTGMVTDSGRFRFRGTDGNTLRLAGLLLDAGVDFERIYSILRAETVETLKFDAYLTQKIRLTENGVAYLHVTKALRKRRGISLEEASDTVSLMEHIKGSLIWIAFIENDDKSIRVRLRSRFVEVREIASKYRGGGHACASGATVYSSAEEAALLRDADELLGRYKAEHPDQI